MKTIKEGGGSRGAWKILITSEWGHSGANEIHVKWGSGSIPHKCAITFV